MIGFWCFNGYFWEDCGKMRPTHVDYGKYRSIPQSTSDNEKTD